MRSVVENFLIYLRKSNNTMTLVYEKGRKFELRRVTFILFSYFEVEGPCKKQAIALTNENNSSEVKSKHYQ